MRTIFSLEVYCVQNCWRQILKPEKGKSGGGRRHQGVGGEEDDTLVWSERILPCTSLASAGCARASPPLLSPSLFFYSISSALFPLALRSLHSTLQMWLYPSVSRGIKFWLRPSVELPRTCGCPLISSLSLPHSFFPTCQPRHFISWSWYMWISPWASCKHASTQ